MFQYACVKALSLRVGVSCSFPEKKPNIHTLFDLSCDKSFQPESGETTGLYVEQEFSYSKIPTTFKSLLVEGYFQSEKYFKDFSEEIREEFKFKKRPVMEIPDGACSIHVRRGDYTNLQSYHPLCGMDYYLKAMSLIPSKKYIIFSDDPGWCSSTFTDKNVQVVRGNSAEEDMQLMALCSNHIIANSSFGWWGAWLGYNRTKKVVAPSKWFGPGFPNHDTKDICPEDWLVV